MTELLMTRRRGAVLATTVYLLLGGCFSQNVSNVPIDKSCPPTTPVNNWEPAAWRGLSGPSCASSSISPPNVMSLVPANALVTAGSKAFSWEAALDVPTDARPQTLYVRVSGHLRRAKGGSLHLTVSVGGRSAGYTFRKASEALAPKTLKFWKSEDYPAGGDTAPVEFILPFKTPLKDTSSQNVPIKLELQASASPAMVQVTSVTITVQNSP